LFKSKANFKKIKTGCAIAFPFFAYIIDISSWEYVFHASFIIGTIWFIFWQLLVFDSPEEHPRIEAAEKDYILQVLGSSVIRKGEEDLEIPWKDILTSRCVWVPVVTQFGGIYGLFTLLTQTPVYFKSIHGWGIQEIGLISGIPHIGRTVFSIGFSKYCDYLLTHDKMARVNVRKFATFFRKTL
jgi:sugar phosphate permease